MRSGGSYSGRSVWSSATTSRASDALNHAPTPAGTWSGAVTRSWISRTPSGEPTVTSSGTCSAAARLLAQDVVGDDRAEAVGDDDERLVDVRDRRPHDGAHALREAAEEVRVDVLERDLDELLEDARPRRTREREHLGGALGRLQLLAFGDRLGGVGHRARIGLEPARGRQLPRRPRRRAPRVASAGSSISSNAGSGSGSGCSSGAQYAMRVPSPASRPNSAWSHWRLSRSARTLLPLPCTYTTIMGPPPRVRSTCGRSPRTSTASCVSDGPRRRRSARSARARGR